MKGKFFYKSNYNTVSRKLQYIFYNFIGILENAEAVEMQDFRHLRHCPRGCANNMQEAVKMAKNTTTSRTSNAKAKREDVSGMQYENKAAYRNAENTKARNARNEQSEYEEDCHNSYKSEKDEY